MRLKLQHDYPASLDDLWAIFSDGAYLERKYRALGATAFQLRRFSASPDRIEVELERRALVDADELPDWVWQWVDREQTLRHVSEWRRVSQTQAAADLCIVPVDVPVSVKGRGAITEVSPKQTRMTLSFEVRCRFPLVGDQVAKFVARQIREALEADYEFTLGYIAGTL